MNGEDFGRLIKSVVTNAYRAGHTARGNGCELAEQVDYAIAVLLPAARSMARAAVAEEQALVARVAARVAP